MHRFVSGPLNVNELLLPTQDVDATGHIWMVSWWIYVADVELTIFN